MERTKMKTLSLKCPSCGGKVELSADGKKATCPYCGHTILIEKEEYAKKEYERRMAKARAEEDIKDLRDKRQRRRRLRGWLIALCVIAGILLINLLIPGSPMRELVFPRTADPFEIVKVRFSGMSGDGSAEVQLSNHNAAEYTDAARFEVTPRTGLSNGDTVTVKAKAPAGWRFEPAEKQFTVEGLTEWVTGTGQLNGDNLAAIHANTERLIREDWEDIVSSSLATDMTYTPYRMYLFISDEDTGYERNVLYDTYEVKVTRKDGSVLTSYEACRYTDLKIPADGILTAGYGSLQGFNFGYNQGFSYAQSFSGWTDAAEMEADLRHVRNGYHLVD
jgi:DNA-directed RNA polymerase, subunit RPC10 (contains C4-type Zn-finger)